MLLTWIICSSAVDRAGDIGMVHSLVLAIRFLLHLASLSALENQLYHNIGLSFKSDYKSKKRSIWCFISEPALAMDCFSVGLVHSSPLKMFIGN